MQEGLPAGPVRDAGAGGSAVPGEHAAPETPLDAALDPSLDAARRPAPGDDALVDESYRAETLFQDLPIPAWLYDLETLRIVDVNVAAVAQYGHSRDQFLALTLFDLRPPEDRHVLERTRSVVRERGLQRGRFRHWWRDGSIRDVEVTTRDLIVRGRAARLAVVQDITDRLAAERTAMAARDDADRVQERLRFTLAAARLGAWELDLVTGALVCTDQMRANYGVVAGQPFDYAALLESIVPEDREAMEAAMQAAIDRRTPYAAEYRVRWADGSEHWILSQGRAFYDEGARPLRITGVTQDVTLRKLAETERERLLELTQEARAEAEAANAAKAQFLAMISHELRTPLNSIGGYAQLLELGLRGPVTRDQRDDLLRIQHNQAHLLGLINSVLHYAKLEAGRVQYAIADVRVAEALAAVESLVAPQLAAKSLRYALRADDPAVVVRADPEKLRQIVVNLLTNAVKFTPAGGAIDVECNCAPEDAADPTVQVRVRDTGVGIPADKLARVFEPFVQASRALTSTDQGVGLGLAISRELARGMGGDVSVVSAVGRGSTFTLTLPRG